MGDGEPSSSAGSGGGSIFGQFFGDLFGMPRWQKLVFTLATLVGAVGLGGRVTGMMSEESGAPVTGQTASDSSPRSGFVSTSAAPNGQASPVNEDPSLKAMLVRNAPWMTRVGVGFVAAFIIGWIFRAFIKLMTMMTIVVVLLLAGLSYFRVIDIDFSKAQDEYATATAWVTDQATKLKDAIMAHIPASMSSTVGMFLGFRRK